MERWSELDGYRLSEVTLNGTHNTYDQYKYRYLPDGLNHGQVLEIDFYAQDWPSYDFKVSHDCLDLNCNNCYHPSNGTRGQDIKSCIDDFRRWHDR